jgi:hypothetical protein
MLGTSVHNQALWQRGGFPNAASAMKDSRFDHWHKGACGHFTVHSTATLGLHRSKHQPPRLKAGSLELGKEGPQYRGGSRAPC